MFDFLGFFGRLFGQVPMRKCPGVRGSKSLGTELIGDSGREFNIPSICITSVRNSSYERIVLPMIFLRCSLTAFTPASHNPPKCGARGGIIVHCVPRFVANCEIEFLLFARMNLSCISSFRAPIKFVPLSLNIAAGTPRLATNRFNAAMHASVVKVESIFR